MSLMMWVWILAGAAGILAIVCVCMAVKIRKQKAAIKGLNELFDLQLEDWWSFIQDSAKCIKALYGELRDRCYNIDDVMKRLEIADNTMMILVKEEFKDERD